MAKERKTEALNLRLTKTTRDGLDIVAEHHDKTVTEWIEDRVKYALRAINRNK